MVDKKEGYKKVPYPSSPDRVAAVVFAVAVNDDGVVENTYLAILFIGVLFLFRAWAWLFFLFLLLLLVSYLLTHSKLMRKKKVLLLPALI